MSRFRRRVPIVLAATTVSSVVVLGGLAASPASAETCTGTVASCAAWGAGSSVGGKISRDEVHDRMMTWVDHKSITYSMSGRHAGPGGWGSFRRDCSGFVSMALHLSDKDGGGPNTVSLKSRLTAISTGSLKMGDILGKVGDGSAGENGHVQIFVNWTDSKHTKARVAEQGGLASVPNYPHIHTYSWPIRMDDGTALKAYRYKDITS